MAEEPEPAENLLLGRDNVVLTPHSAFYSQESMNRFASVEFARNYNSSGICQLLDASWYFSSIISY